MCSHVCVVCACVTITKEGRNDVNIELKWSYFKKKVVLLGEKKGALILCPTDLLKVWVLSSKPLNGEHLSSNSGLITCTQDGLTSSFPVFMFLFPPSCIIALTKHSDTVSNKNESEHPHFSVLFSFFSFKMLFRFFSFKTLFATCLY